MLYFRMNMPLILMALYGSIMILAVLLLRLPLKNRLPKFVFPVLWGVVLLRFLVPFSFSSPLSAPVPEIALPVYRESTALLSKDSALLSKGINLLSTVENVVVHSSDENTATVLCDYADGYGNFPRWLLTAAYLAGLALTAGFLGYQKYCYSRKLQDRMLLEHNDTVNTLLRGMGMGHVLVFTNDSIASPLVCGLLNPRIYLPTRMDFGSTVLLGHILAHETMHIRRKDNWMKAVMLAVLCLNWYNPLVWLMSKCLSSDLEAACDEAVLKPYDEEERKNYALSLLAMAVTGSRATLLYSAFSKTEVEKRIQSIVHYRKASLFVLLFSVLFLTCGIAALATGGQAPFSSQLSSFCGSGYSKWGVQAEITRGISLGKNPQNRADDVIFSVLREDGTENPEILEEAIKTALAKEFGVERSAFRLTIRLCLSKEEIAEEYKPWGLVRNENGVYFYQGEQVRVYEDKLLGSFQSSWEGAVDISVKRNLLGEITEITALRQGDSEFDRRSYRIEQDKMRSEYQEEIYNSAKDTTVDAVQVPSTAVWEGTGSRRRFW